MSTTRPSYEAVADRFNRAAATYDASGMHSWLTAQVAKQAAAIPATSVLDIATGTGLAIEAMIARGSTASFTGVDISAGMLAEAARKPLAARTEFLLLDANELPFADDAFDLTICVSAMPYFPDAVKALAEWSRVTRNGKIVFTAWALGGLMLPRLVRQAAEESGVQLPDPNAGLGTPDQIDQTTAKAGLCVNNLITAEHHEPLRDSDTDAWERVTGSEFGVPMQHAAEAVQQQARIRFGRLLQASIDAGEPNVSRTYIIETANTHPR